jgi:mycofactocin precursor peptide peptidase
MEDAGALRLEHLAWTDLDGRRPPTVIVPVGSCEQHGPHLPLGTDTVIATELALGLAARRAGCVIAPTLPITASGEHQGFPGTLSIGTEVMAGVVIELARSAEWAAGVVFVNGHGGNNTAMQRAAEVFGQERRNVLVWWPRFDLVDPRFDPHAGHTETSLMLAISPDRVRAEEAAAGPIPTLAELVTHGVRALSGNGVLGDPTGASADLGRIMLDRLIDQLVEAVDAAGIEWAAR